jgi:hypothetical protein
MPGSTLAFATLMYFPRRSPDSVMSSVQVSLPAAAIPRLRSPRRA